MTKPKKVYIGITPTGWTNDDMPLLGNEIHFEQCISEMALAGYQGCSIGHKYPTDARVLGEALAQRKLSISEPWVSTYFLLPEGTVPTIDSCKERIAFIKQVHEANMQWRNSHGERTVTLPAADIVVAELSRAVHQLPLPAIPSRPRFTAQEWTTLADQLKNLGNVVHEHGMKLCYHPHIGTGIQTIEEVIMLMDHIKDSHVSLLLDTGHLYYAEYAEEVRAAESTKQKEDSIASVQEKLQDLTHRYAQGIKHVHLKNIRQSVLNEAIAKRWSFLYAVQQGIFTVPGDPEGVIDFKPILETMMNAGYEGWLVVEAEQDPAKAAPLYYAQMAYDYLQEALNVPSGMR